MVANKKTIYQRPKDINNVLILPILILGRVKVLLTFVYCILIDWV